MPLFIQFLKSNLKHKDFIKHFSCIKMIAHCASFAKSVQPLGVQLLRSSSTIYCIHMKPCMSIYNSRLK